MTEIHAFDPDGTPSPGAQTALDSAVAAIPESVLDPQVASAVSDGGTSTRAALDGLTGRGIMTRFPRLPGDKDDTERLQRAMDWCASASAALSLAGDPWVQGAYIVSELVVPAGLTMFDLAGATLKRPNLSAAPYNYTLTEKKWSRMLVWSHEGASDSPVFTIQNGTFDGNCWENWTDNSAPSYEQEQASLIIISGDNATGGRARANLRGVHFQDSVSDGLHVVRNATVEVSDCSSHDCFRGGLVITGGNDTVTGNGWVSTSSRPDMPDGIDVEVDSPGFGESREIVVSLSNFTLDRDLDVGVPEGSHVSLTNVILKTPGWNLGGSGTTVITGGSLAQGGTGRLLVVPGTKVRFIGTTLRGEGPGVGTAAPLSFLDNTGSSHVEFSGVTFEHCATGVAGSTGLLADVAFTGGTRFAEDVDLAIGGPHRGIPFVPRSITIDGVEFSNSGYWLRSHATQSAEQRVSVGSLAVTNPANTGLNIHSPQVTWRAGAVLTNGVQVTIASGGTPSILGTRTVVVDADPNDSAAWGSNRLFGRSGDTAVTRDRTRRWVCIGYDRTPGRYYHVWEERAVESRGVGTSGNRPTSPPAGTQFLDTTLGKPVWWVGDRWVDAAGATA